MFQGQVSLIEDVGQENFLYRVSGLLHVVNTGSHDFTLNIGFRPPNSAGPIKKEIIVQPKSETVLGLSNATVDVQPRPSAGLSFSFTFSPK